MDSLIAETTFFKCDTCKKSYPVFKGFTVFSEKYRDNSVRLCKKCNKILNR